MLELRFLPVKAVAESRTTGSESLVADRVDGRRSAGGRVKPARPIWSSARSAGQITAVSPVTYPPARRGSRKISASFGSSFDQVSR